MYGPFFTLLPISFLSRWLLGRLAALAPADDQPLRRFLLVPRLDSFLLAPRAHNVAPAARSSAVRVIDGVHYFAAHFRPLAEPAGFARLAVRHQLVLGVANDADRRQTGAVHHSHFRRSHAKSDVLTFLGDDFDRRSRRSRDLSALARLELDVVNVGTERNLTKRHRVSRARVRTGPGNDFVPDRQALRVNDVALLSVLVLDKGDSRRPVRIVLDVSHRRRHVVLVPLEVDDPVVALVPAADAPHRDVPVIVASAALLQRLDKRLLRRRSRDLGEIRDAAEARALRYRLELTNSHSLTLEDVYRVALAELHDRFLPMRPSTDGAADPARLSALVRRPYAGDLHSEQLLDSCPDGGLRRVAGDAERVFAALLIRRRGLLGDDRTDERAMNGAHRLLPLLLCRRLLRRRLPRGFLRSRLLRRRLATSGLYLALLRRCLARGLCG